MRPLNEQEASQFLNLPPFLLRDFVSFEFNGSKLISVSQEKPYLFELQELHRFGKHLFSRFSDEARKAPEFIKRYAVLEANGKCALCLENKPNYEIAHIEAWSEKHCHHPHNVLYLCLDCHTTHGNNKKLLKALKEQKLTTFMGISTEHIYDCEPSIKITDAVYVLNGKVFLANARHQEASGIVSRKIGADRCLIQRYGVLTSFQNLKPGQRYHLSPLAAGEIVIWEDGKHDLPETAIQLIGRAESETDLVIHLQLVGYTS